MAANATSYTDTGLTPGTACAYHVRAFDDDDSSMYSNTVRTKTWIELRLLINQTRYYVNDGLKVMDTTTIVRGGRTLLPIKYVAELMEGWFRWIRTTPTWSR